MDGINKDKLRNKLDKLYGHLIHSEELVIELYELAQVNQEAELYIKANFKFDYLKELYEFIKK